MTSFLDDRTTVKSPVESKGNLATSAEVNRSVWPELGPKPAPAPEPEPATVPVAQSTCPAPGEVKLEPRMKDGVVTSLLITCKCGEQIEVFCEV